MTAIQATMGKTEPFAERVSAYVGRAERILESHLPGTDVKPSRLHEAMRYAALGNGKRMRPLLCYATAESLGVPADAVDDAACAVELVHTFSLVHDDLPAMDDDDLRRGRPTVHKAFGEATAILVGDALQTLAFGVLAHARCIDPEHRVAMLATLADATGSTGMTGGQVLDLAAEDTTLELRDLEDLHRLKTGRLIRASIRMACHAADAEAGLRARLDRFAENIGLAFQIRDDLLDVEGDTAVIGKTQGADAAHGKSTYPALLGTADARRRAESLYDDALEALDPLGDAAGPLRWMAAYIVRRDR